MESFHCNQCGHLPFIQGVDPRRYFITNCGHVFCVNCAGNGAGGFKEQCGVCKANCKTAEISQQSSQDIKAYFMDASTLYAETFKKVMKVTSFQKAQMKNFQMIIMNMYEMCRKAHAENNLLKNKLAACELENQEWKRKYEAMQQEQQRWLGAESCGRNGTTANGNGFQIHMGRRNDETPSPATSTFSGLFNRGPTRNFFDTPSTTASIRGSPFTMMTPTDQFLTPSSTPKVLDSATPARRTPSSSPAPFNGRVISRNASLERIPQRETEHPGTPAGFYPAPGANRHGNRSDQNQSDGSATPDLSSRLRGLRCSVAKQFK